MRVLLLPLLSTVLLFPSFAGAVPIIAGFGDSITCDTCNDGSYLGLLGDYLDPDPIIDDNGVSADLTSGVLSRLGDWIDDGNTADFLILLAGTPDTYMAVGGWQDRDYDPVETLLNIEAMIDLVLAESIPLILVAPPPVLEPCDNPVALTCDQIDTRLADLAYDLSQLAIDNSVAFLDLYAAFETDPRFGLIGDGGQHPGPNSLYRDDGLHPRLETGDTLIASLVAPMIPEPSTALLLSSGLLILAHRRRSRRKPAITTRCSSQTPA